MIGQRSQYSGFWDALNVFLNPAAAIAQGANAPPIIEGALSPIQTLVGEQDVMTQGFQQNNQTLQAITGGLDRAPVDPRFSSDRSGGFGLGRRFRDFLANRKTRQNAGRGGGGRTGQGANLSFLANRGGGSVGARDAAAFPATTLAPRAAAPMQPGGGTPWGWILGGLGVLALVGGGIWFATRRKKKRGRR